MATLALVKKKNAFTNTYSTGVKISVDEYL